MSIRIYSKIAEQVTNDEEKVCRRMISGGAIYNVYSGCCDPKSKLRNRIFLAKDTVKNRLVGWAIITELYKKTKKGKNHFEFMVYIKFPYRRQGIATRFYKRAKSYFKLKDEEIDVFKTDKRNTEFYKSVRKNDI